MIESVLVANRGEIALRVIRAARELGIRTIAVFSEADRDSPHVVHADEAILIGPAAASKSYLDIGRVLRAARTTGAVAVHPGYGFLAERADFARAVAEAGLIFVGPAAETIRAMGDKTEARRRMADAGVPVVPGTTSPLGSGSEAREVASEVGLPVVLKAAAGGGGKGMRVVRRLDEVAAAFDAAAREARAAFGDDSVYVERFLERPRHIEVQLFGDGFGNVVHLHERECSIQRRHQKLIEEAPSSLLGPEERRAVGEAAVRAAHAVNYIGAGTVEFLYRDEEFFFLEMNTRLQVEHPVTEFVTGVDLVEWQFRVASGDGLPMRQSEIPLRGHAIECRITSESPFDGFLPATGTVRHLAIPGGPGVRWDGGIGVGNEIGLHYDPLLGKLITWAPDRESAIRRMRRALGELAIAGVSTCTPLLRRVLDEPDFLAGRLSTAYLTEHPELFDTGLDDASRTAAVAAAALLEHGRRAATPAPRIGRRGVRFSDWRAGTAPWVAPIPDGNG
ncbi:MAG: acetyl-CoA carboxylase biotin carboxylase subunit [Gemmatimonadota bacterium]|nr:acetyl-CoA carboxylase biotin carboxylase subunit [Gemmatimonadota bacterium]